MRFSLHVNNKRGIFVPFYILDVRQNNKFLIFLDECNYKKCSIARWKNHHN